VSQRGQAAAEFALVLPFLALLVMGLVDFGRCMAQYVAAINAAREGVRYCALYPGANTVALQSRIVSSGTDPDTAELGGRYPAGDVTFRAWLTDPVSGNEGARGAFCPSGTAGQEVSVEVRIAFRAITPLIDRLFPVNPLPVGGAARMPVTPA
jgi:hypothetical protein